jgi:hypothetical protein
VEYAEWSDALTHTYWAEHCPQHRCNLPCAECEAELLEERRQEGFLTVQEYNARILKQAWELGEHLGPKQD